jgi:hypothetical protein
MTKSTSILVSAAVVLVLAGAFAFWSEGAAKKSSCPSGTQKFVHVCIEKTARADADFPTASAACAADKRRLPTSAELDSFRQQPGITLASPSEWTSDFNSAISALGISDAGNYGDFSLTSAQLPFRCVA